MARLKTDELDQQNKLANSYQSLLSDFSSSDLHTVGNYALGRLIGKGSFGKVYLASHKLTNGSKVVLKSAKKDDANLAREIHHHRQFLHPHIARLYEVIVTENLVWLVLEYCPGDELYNHILNHGRMAPEKVQKIFTQLVGAVNYVHAKGCVHRDLKLENILLDKHENVKLVDFGFTREYKGATSYLQTWCGTVCYSAPEMLKGEKYAGEKVDVWSLGIILFALLCGELPFDEDDDSDTKNLILKEDAKYPDYIPEPAKDLLKKLLSKRPLLRPSLGDILRDPWLSDHAPQQQEILKLQQPAPFTTQIEKDVLQRMKSAGVDIDMVIENVLSQRCDSLAGWWALISEKEMRKEKRRERKRKEREAEAKSIRRLSAASGRLLANLGEIHESEESFLQLSPRSRGRRLERANGASIHMPELPKVSEAISASPEPVTRGSNHSKSRSRSRPPPPPKDYGGVTRNRRTASRGSQSMLRTVVTNPDLLSPSYVPPPQRKRPKFYPPPLKEHLAWFKHLFKEGTLKRAKSPSEGDKNKKASSSQQSSPNSKSEQEKGDLRDLQRLAAGPPPQIRRPSVGNRLDMQQMKVPPARPRINTASSTTSAGSNRVKRTSLSPHTLTPHSSYRRTSGLRGRKSTSSSVSSIRSTYQGRDHGHQHSHSKASSTSSASIASPSGLSSASGSRLGRSPHNSVKVLPSTPVGGSFPSGIRFSRRAPPGDIGSLPAFGEGRRSSGGAWNSGMAPPPVSPGLPVFAKRKRSVFKGPMNNGSPGGFGRTSNNGGSAGSGAGGGSGSRSASVPGRPSGEMMPGVEEEDEEEDELYEEVDQFGPDLRIVVDGFVTGNEEEEEEGNTTEGFTAPVSPMSPGMEGEMQLGGTTTAALVADGGGGVAAEGGGVVIPTSLDAGVEEKSGGGGLPLTAEALAQMEEENDAAALEAEEAAAASRKGKGK